MERLFVFCTGVLLAACQSELIYPYQSLLLFIVAVIFLLVLYRKNLCKFYVVSFASFLLGFFYFDHMAGARLSQIIPESLEKKPLRFVVEVESLPQIKNGNWQAVVAVSGQPENTEAWSASSLLLTWPKGLRPQACSQWSVEVSMKRPRSLSNPGGFDYELFLLVQGIEAKGYVRQAFWYANKKHCINKTRESWRQHLFRLIPESAAGVLALTSGDKSSLSRQQYAMLAETGIAHLFVISGLHISLVAMAVYALVMLLRRLRGGLIIQGDWRPIATLLALGCSAAYVMFAGHQVAAVRAWVMLLVFMLPRCLPLQWSLWHRFWLSMAVVLLINPLQIMSIGFQLSFLAVALLILIIERLPDRKDTLWYHKLSDVIRVQWYLALGMLPLMLLSFGKTASFGLLYNLISIPIATLIIVPLCLVTLVLWLLGVEPQWLLDILDMLFKTYFSWVESMHSLLGGELDIGQFVYHGLLSPWILSYSVFWIVVFRGVLQVPGYVLLIAVCVFTKTPALEKGELEMHVLDVGQGLSIMIKTQSHAMLYDTGSAWPENSMAQLAVLPALQHMGVFNLDKLVISHNDNDHAGGVNDIMSKIPITQLLQNKSPLQLAQPCEAGMSWQWDGVEFDILHPNTHYFADKRNNESCVLLVKAGDKSILLAGDIEKSVEIALVKAGLPSLDILIAPHHGSKTSSSFPLVRLAENAHVVFSSGYLNRFRHPHPKIIQRYQSFGSKIHQTSEAGMISFFISGNEPVSFQYWRQHKTRFWHKN